MKPRVSAITAITEKLARRVNEREQRWDHDPSAKILGLLEGLESKVRALERMNATPNPMDTPAAQLRKMAHAALRLKEESEAVDEKITNIFEVSAKDIAMAIDKQAGLVEGKFDVEVRAAFRAMTDEQRGSALNNALREGNSEVIAAICLAPGILSGANQELQGRYLEAIRKQKAPDLLAKFDELTETLHTATTVKRIAGTLFDENYKRSELAKIDQAEREALEAELAFSGGGNDAD